MANLIQLRRGPGAEWRAVNPILAEGEEGYELDTHRRKVGDGVRPWVDLPYDGATAADGGPATTGGLLTFALPQARDQAGVVTSEIATPTFSTSAPAGLTLLGPLQAPVTVRGALLSLTGDGSTATNRINEPHAHVPTPTLEFDWTVNGNSPSAGPLVIRVGAPTGGTNAFRAEVWTDGVRHGTAVTGTLAANALGYLSIAPPAGAATRRVRVRLERCAFAGVMLKPSYHTVTATRDRRPRVAAFGDSWVEGAAGVNELALWPAILGELLGVGAVARMGQGGSGYVAQWDANSAMRYTDPQRLQRLREYAPDLLIVQGSQNDDTAGGPAITAAATIFYAAVADALPECQVIVIGPPRIADPPSAARLANRDAVRSAAIAAPNVLGFIDTIGGDASTAVYTPGDSYVTGQTVRDATGVVYRVLADHTAPAGPSYYLTPLSWITGTGHISDLRGDGNADLAVFFDRAHLTALGHQLYARRAFHAIAALYGAR